MRSWNRVKSCKSCVRKICDIEMFNGCHANYNARLCGPAGGEWVYVHWVKPVPEVKDCSTCGASDGEGLCASFSGCKTYNNWEPRRKSC